MQNLRWIAAAALSAYACHLAVHHATPIDRALPLLALAVTLLARLSYPALMLGVPMLVAAEIAIADEHMRLLAFGAIMAAVTACATVDVGRASARPGENVGRASARPGENDARASAHPGESDGRAEARPTFVALVVIVVLRWLPLEQVHVFRELFILIVAAAIVVVLGRTPFAVVVAVITALVTPAVPLRTLALPVIVLFTATLARTFGMPALRLAWPSSMVLGFVMLFFAWSGIVARAFPYFLREREEEVRRSVIAQALAPNRTATYEVPEGATRLVVSGANVAHLRRGALLGRIQPGNIPVRIGDAADWGYLRRDHWYLAHNPLPRDAAGKIRDYGYGAWLDGAGRVPLPRGARTIRVTADARLPANASLQVEGFE